MEYRVTLAILLFSIVSFVFSYHIKFSFVDPLWIVNGSGVGLFVFGILSFVLRNSSDLTNKLLIIPYSGSFVNNHKYFWIAGIFLGGYTGYSLSIMCKGWESLNGFKFCILFSHTLCCWGCVVGLFIVENHRSLREFSKLAYNRIDQIRMTEFLGSFAASLIIADYASTMLVIYLGFFAFMYYYIYVIYTWSPYYVLCGAGGVCFLNFLANAYRILILLPRRRKQKQEQETLGIIIAI